MVVSRRTPEGLALILISLFAGGTVACVDDSAVVEADADADTDTDTDADTDADTDTDTDADADAGADAAAAIPCAEGAMTQDIAPGLAGCGGAVLYADRATLCASEWHVCTADEWAAGRGDAVPENHYWTDDGALGFAWSGDPGTEDFTCWVDDTAVSGVQACEEGEPMHVCTPGDRGDLPQGTEAVVDAFENGCNWINCGLGVYPTTHYFGGCSGNDTAGALCCQ